MSNNVWHIFQDDVSGLYFADDPCDVWPEPTVIVKSTARTRGAEWLAGESGCDDIHAATPRFAVEGYEVVPYRGLIQSRLAHPFHEDGRRVGVPFNVTHGSYSEGFEGDAESSIP